MYNSILNSSIFSNISKIIERDSKTTTYKFALLRGVIDIIQDNSPYISFSKERVYFFTGLLIEKWLLYYYPILESTIKIPQINVQRNLAFESQYKTLIYSYKRIGGFSVFYNDLKNNGIPKELQADFLDLIKIMSKTITQMPMKHLGWSINNTHYSIFNYTTRRVKTTTKEIDLEFLIRNFGLFSIPIEYYEALKIIGSFINGKDSILLKWAQFSVNASGRDLTIEKVVNEVLKSPITDRDISESKKIYKSILNKDGKVFCVWTGKAIKNFDIDHVIPFSVWKNNDLWNLLPSQSSTNNQKRNKIPSVDLIEKRKNLIIHYWELLNKDHFKRFQKEIRLALLGMHDNSEWQKVGIAQLKKNCNYLISTRGFEEWTI